MRRLTILAVALALAVFTVGALAGVPLAQEDLEEDDEQEEVPAQPTADDPQDPDPVYEVCEPAEAKIEADELPRVEDEDGEFDEPDERTLEPKVCPVQGRPIVDNGIGSAVPERGKGIHAEAYGVGGSQELGVARLSDGTVELTEVGDESAQQGGDGSSNSPNACDDNTTVLSGDRYRMAGSHPWRINRSTIPSRNDPDRVILALRAGGNHIQDTYNNCGIGDKVPGSYLSYKGDTGYITDITENNQCIAGTDEVNSVDFGNLGVDGSGRPILAFNCVQENNDQNPNTYDPVIESDIRFNSSDGRLWTTYGDDQSVCDYYAAIPGTGTPRGEWDVESTMTHERGHSFGVAHVPEETNGRLTMSAEADGPCQTRERTLGLGDAISLDRLY